MEVLVALAIFVISVIALGQLMNISGEMASDAQYLNRANQLAQKQMNSVVSGVVPMTSQSETNFDEAPDWTWSLDAQADNTPNLWHVTVTVSHKRSDGSSDFEQSLYQMVLDPIARGNLGPTNNPNSGGTTSGGSTP